ncbi:MAG TPA: hypothetical protein VE359_09655 [Vicinamibacteria bacterium]|nr:hypothetical protein [Vicinamibacteria bacterium]
MLMIQIAAAVLLVLGSALIFRALLELDAPTRPGRVARRRLRPVEPESEMHLPKAA